MNVNRYHIYYWLVYYAFVFVLDYIAYGPFVRVDRELLVFFMQLCVFYSFLFALLHFKKDNFWNWFKSIGRILLSFSLIIFLNYLRSRLAAYYGIDLHSGSVRVFLTETVAIYLQFSFYALGYYYITRFSTKQKEIRQLAEEKTAQDLAHAQLQQNMLEMENNFLRAQINPHFLYNTLNLFYAKALPTNKDLAGGILTLADIMRYSLETTHGGQLVSLSMEVAHLKRVISMHQLRFENRLPIQFDTKGNFDGIQVVPLIFITLLENALKHGEVEDPDEPIVLWLEADETNIYFTIRNKKGNAFKEHSHGIGLDNIQKRLNNIYDNHYQLRIEETSEVYKVLLTIEHTFNPMGETQKLTG